MQPIVVERQLYSSSQFPNLILEYVLGDDNLADIFSQPPFVRPPTVAGLGLTLRSPQEAPSLRHKTASPATSVNVVSTHAQQRREPTMAPVVTRCAQQAANTLQHARRAKKEVHALPAAQPLGEAKSLDRPVVPLKDKDEMSPVLPQREEVSAQLPTQKYEMTQ